MLFSERLAESRAPRSESERAPNRPPEQGEALTETERVILDALATGGTYQQIAKATGRSPSTVRSHLHHVYVKLGVVDRAQAVLEAHRRGIITAPGLNGHAPGLFESTATSDFLDMVPTARRNEHLRQRKAVADVRVAAAVPKPYLPESERDPFKHEEAARPKEGALADVLIALHLKGVEGTEASLADAFEAAMGPDGRDRYGKLVKLAAEAMSAATRVKVLTSRV